MELRSRPRPVDIAERSSTFTEALRDATDLGRRGLGDDSSTRHCRETPTI
jgi:hypothetical protein